MKDSCPRSQEGVHGEVEITAEHAPESKMDLTFMGSRGVLELARCLGAVRTAGLGGVGGGAIVAMVGGGAGS